MAFTRRSPRRDPVLLYRIQSDFAAGLAPAQIAEKHTLPLFAVTQALRRATGGEISDPFTMARRPSTRDAALMYWIGYVAACGSVYDGAIPTLVLDVDPRDLLHLQALLDDLCQARPSFEYCRSSLRGLQAYVRDPELGRLMVRWGIPGGDPGEGGVPVTLVPPALLSHFVRGYLEGGRGTPPFGGQSTPPSLRQVKRIVFAGPSTFLEALRKALRRQIRAAGTLTGSGHPKLTYTGVHAQRLLRFAYRDARRSLPRADRLRRSLQRKAHSNGATPAR